MSISAAAAQRHRGPSARDMRLVQRLRVEAFPPAKRQPSAPGRKRLPDQHMPDLHLRDLHLSDQHMAAPDDADTPSSLLRRLLAQNPNVKRFTVRHVIASMGYRYHEASLMLFSIPGMIPMPGTTDFVGSPTMAIAGQMIAGRKEVRLPRFFLERSVPRRALAIAIHTILPILERAESLMRPRWQWACTPAAKRVIGVLVFLIALPLAFPFLGFNVPHAASLFTISIGLIEKDGLAIVLGVAAGIISLVMLTGANLSPTVLSRKALDWIKTVVGQVTSVSKTLASAARSTLRWISERIMSGGVPRASATKANSATTHAPNVSRRHRRDVARQMPLAFQPLKEAFRPLRSGVSIPR